MDRTIARRVKIPSFKTTDSLAKRKDTDNRREVVLAVYLNAPRRPHTLYSCTPSQNLPFT